MKNKQITSTPLISIYGVNRRFSHVLRSLACCALVLGFNGLANAQEAVVETDSLLCEGSWVTISASAAGCAVTSVSWQKNQSDGSPVQVDGSQYFHELDGHNLKTQSDGSYTAILSCDDGSALQGDGQVMQQIDDSKC